MPRYSRLTTAALVAAAVSPAAALAANAELRGAPTLRLDDPDQATVSFVLDEKLPRKASGGYDAYVKFSDQGMTSIYREGRHGDGYKYASAVKSAHRLRVGQKYTVQIVVAGNDKPIVRKVRLRNTR